MERMTEEQVRALRLASPRTLVFEGSRWVFSDAAFCGMTQREYVIDQVALAVANGHLPPSALDAVWDAVEGHCPAAAQTAAPSAPDTERRALWAAYVAEWGFENIDQADRALAAFDARFGGGK